MIKYFLFISVLFFNNDTTYICRRSDCDLLNKIEKCYYNGNTNFECLQLNIDSCFREIEKSTGIESRAELSYFGYSYQQDSVFYEDINRWRNALKCD